LKFIWQKGNLGNSEDEEVVNKYLTNLSLDKESLLEVQVFYKSFPTTHNYWHKQIFSVLVDLNNRGGLVKSCC